MGRLSGDPAVVHSSIALLQERFRQLQRVKEMREERELLRSFTKSEVGAVGACYEQQPRCFIHPDLIHPSRPLLGSKDLRAESHGGDHAKLRSFSSSCLSMGLRPDRPNLNNSNEMDVDTSLHL